MEPFKSHFMDTAGLPFFWQNYVTFIGIISDYMAFCTGGSKYMYSNTGNF